MDYFSIDNMQTGKLVLHAAQAFLIFLSWCLMIAVFHNAFFITGGPIWYFILCFLSVPPIVYETLTPRFERSRRWGNPYAFAILDVVFTILWLSAFASLAAFNSSGLCFGACDISKACVGLGFFIFLFFALTSAISVYGVFYFRREGVLPGASRTPTNAAMIDPHREAFSTAPHDEDEYAPVNMHDADHHQEDVHHEMDSADGSGVGSYDPTASMFGSSTEYAGAGAGRGAGRVVYAPPTVSDMGDGSSGYRRYGAEDLEHGGYDGAGSGRVRFPAGNYS